MHTQETKQNKKTPPRSASLLKTVWSDILTVWNIFETNKISEKVIHFQLFILLSLVFLLLKQNKNRRIIFIFLHKCLSPMSMLKYAHLALSRNCLVYIFFINCKLELIKKKWQKMYLFLICWTFWMSCLWCKHLQRAILQYPQRYFLEDER